jgi:acetyl esterase
MRHIATICAATCFAWTAMAGAAQAQCPPIAVANPEGNYIVPGVQGGISYRHVNGIDLSLDAYVQQRGAGRPAVIVVHGGAWDTGSRVAFTGQLQELLTKAGYSWFAVDYRLGGLVKHQEAVDDLRAAVEFIRCHAADFRIDPENIALLGEDAGAHLAMLLAAEAPRGITAVVGIGGFYDLRELAGLTTKHAADLLTEASPATRDLQRMPPALLIHGGNDPEVPPQQANAFCQRLRSLGRACQLAVVEGAIHRTENWWPSQWRDKTVLTTWLADVLRLAEADHEPYVSRLTKGIVFSPKHGLELDAYTPAGAGPFAAVIIAHGGGWEAGDRVTYVTPLFEPLARAGFAWFSIDYRPTPEVRNEDQIDDLAEAIRFVRANAARFRVDPDRIAILGESASGQMVAALATRPAERVAAVVSFYGVYDFLQMATSFAPRSVPARLFGLTAMSDESRAVLMRFSPLHQVTRGMPPMLLIQGTADRLYPQATAFSERLTAANVDHERYDVVGAPHGIENWEGHPEWLGYKRKLVEWLLEKLVQSRR